MAGMDRRSALGAAALVAGMASGSNAAAAAPRPRKLSAAQQLDVLASRAEIEELLYDYARGNDHADEAMIRGCFWPESAHKHGGFDGTSMGFVDFAMRLLPKLKYSKHHISNVSVRVNGNRAFSECYYYAHHRRDNAAGTARKISSSRAATSIFTSGAAACGRSSGGAACPTGPRFQKPPPRPIQLPRQERMPCAARMTIIYKMLAIFEAG